MPRGFGRLPFLTRRSTLSDPGAGGHPPMPARSVDPDVAPVGPPVLLPATIVSQVLVDATEITQVWARPRPEPGSVVVPAIPAKAPPTAARKGASRASTAAAKAGRTEATPGRARRAERSPKGDG